MYDAHCHLDRLKDSAAAVRRAQEAGLKLIITNGTGPEDNRQALELESEHDIVRAALGLYPGDAVKLSPEEVDAELEFIRSQNPIAIGEVGLDYHWDDTRKEEMKAVFARVLALAKELGRPVIVHSRKAEADVVEMLLDSQARACLHCFGGSLKLAKRAAEHGVYFSIPATIERSTHFQRLAEETPSELLLTETDSPWLSPDPGDENEPANITRTISVLARIKSLPEVRVEELLWENLRRFLGDDAKAL